MPTLSSPPNSPTKKKKPGIERRPHFNHGTSGSYLSSLASSSSSSSIPEDKESTLSSDDSEVKTPASVVVVADSASIKKKTKSLEPAVVVDVKKSRRLSSAAPLPSSSEKRRSVDPHSSGAGKASGYEAENEGDALAPLPFFEKRAQTPRPSNDRLDRHRSVPAKPKRGGQ